MSNDPDGYCILHSKDENKDIGAFREKVCGRIATTGNRIDLIGCYFPSGFKADFFQKGRVEKPVDFSGATFTKGADFGGATFTKGADFRWATFTEWADFSWATFTEQADFRWATFTEEADFGGATFTEEADFNLAEFTGGANFSGAAFMKRADFGEATFTERADFGGATFTERANFGEATFTEEADFGGATFTKGANFGWATFTKWANFGGATFTEGVFIGTDFKEGACFDHAEFKERVSFRPGVSMEGEKQSVLLGPGSSFQYTRFLKEAMFQDIDLSHCSFLHSNIDKVDFRYCTFAKKPGRFRWFNLNPRQNILKDELEADGSVRHSERSEESRPFAYAQGDRNKKLRGEKYEPVRRLYLELKRNFEDKKDWNTAGDFHYGEMECRRKGRLGGWLDFLLVTTYYRASGYGERPWRAFVVLAILVLFVFPVLLSLNEFLCSFWTSFKDSLGVATFVRFTRILEPVKPGNPWDTCLLVVESIIAYIQIALFALALRRKVKR